MPGQPEEARRASPAAHRRLPIAAPITAEYVVAPGGVDGNAGEGCDAASRPAASPARSCSSPAARARSTSRRTIARDAGAIAYIVHNNGPDAPISMGAHHGARDPGRDGRRSRTARALVAWAAANVGETVTLEGPLARLTSGLAGRRGRLEQQGAGADDGDQARHRSSGLERPLVGRQRRDGRRQPGGALRPAQRHVDVDAAHHRPRGPDRSAPPDVDARAGQERADEHGEHVDVPRHRRRDPRAREAPWGRSRQRGAARQPAAHVRAAEPLLRPGEAGRLEAGDDHGDGHADVGRQDRVRRDHAGGRRPSGRDAEAASVLVHRGRDRRRSTSTSRRPALRPATTRASSRSPAAGRRTRSRTSCACSTRRSSRTSC